MGLAYVVTASSVIETNVEATSNATVAFDLDCFYCGSYRIWWQFLRASLISVSTSRDILNNASASLFCLSGL